VDNYFCAARDTRHTLAREIYRDYRFITPLTTRASSLSRDAACLHGDSSRLADRADESRNKSEDYALLEPRFRLRGVCDFSAPGAARSGEEAGDDRSIESRRSQWRVAY
jgi:hypothetical protein